MASNIDDLIALAGGQGFDTSSLQGTLSGQDVTSSRAQEVEAQLNSLFASATSAIENQPTPPPLPVPDAPSPINSFLAQLGANFGAVLMRNPNLANQVMGDLNRQIEAQHEAQVNNAIREQAFNETRQKESRLLQLRIKEMAVQQALDEGKADKADKLARELEELRARIKREEKIFERSLPPSETVKFQEEQRTARTRLQQAGADRRAQAREARKNVRLRARAGSLIEPATFAARMTSLENAERSITNTLAITPGAQSALDKQKRRIRTQRIELALTPQPGDSSLTMADRLQSFMPDLSPDEARRAMDRITRLFAGLEEQEEEPAPTESE